MLVATFVESPSPTNLHLDFGLRLINIYGNDVEKNISLMLIDETLMQKKNTICKQRWKPVFHGSTSAIIIKHNT